MLDDREYVEQELSGNGKKIYLIIFPHEGEILVDTKGLPETGTLCAMCDGVPFMMAKVGSKKKEQRTFIPIEWVINDWGGPEELVRAVKKRKQIILDEMDHMKTMVKKIKPLADKEKVSDELDHKK